MPETQTDEIALCTHDFSYRPFASVDFTFRECCKCGLEEQQSGQAKLETPDVWQPMSQS